MNWERFESDWNKVKSAVRDQWELLSDDHLVCIAEKREKLVGSVVESYGIAGRMPSVR